MLFGSCTICLNIFRVGYDVSHIHCKSKLELIFPVIEIIFIGIQVTELSIPMPPGTYSAYHIICTHPYLRIGTTPQQIPTRPRVRAYIPQPPHKDLPLCTHIHAHLHVPAPAHTLSLKCRHL